MGLPVSWATVYPRVCGGTYIGYCRVRMASGLSPRVRGNPGSIVKGEKGERSIPACAGEPFRPPAASPRTRVYPRVCGGTGGRLRYLRPATGLSPRVRGNPGPAGASGGGCGVYPRVCGGTPRRQPDSTPLKGLSPRVRGNRYADAYQQPDSGSIPACAGEPRRGCAGVCRRWVYPRVCGGTRLVGVPPGGIDGLSPRVRGNPRRPRPGLAGRRSIPACAGEPIIVARRRRSVKVYPRVGQGYRIWILVNWDKMLMR